VSLEEEEEVRSCVSCVYYSLTHLPAALSMNQVVSIVRSLRCVY